MRRKGQKATPGSRRASDRSRDLARLRGKRCPRCPAGLLAVAAALVLAPRPAGAGGGDAEVLRALRLERDVLLAVLEGSGPHRDRGGETPGTRPERPRETATPPTTPRAGEQPPGSARQALLALDLLASFQERLLALELRDEEARHEAYTIYEPLWRAARRFAGHQVVPAAGPEHTAGGHEKVRAHLGQRDVNDLARELAPTLGTLEGLAPDVLATASTTVERLEKEGGLEDLEGGAATALGQSLAHWISTWKAEALDLEPLERGLESLKPLAKSPAVQAALGRPLLGFAGRLARACAAAVGREDPPAGDLVTSLDASLAALSASGFTTDEALHRELAEHLAFVSRRLSGDSILMRPPRAATGPPRGGGGEAGLHPVRDAFLSGLEYLGADLASWGAGLAEVHPAAGSTDGGRRFYLLPGRRVRVRFDLALEDGGEVQAAALVTTPGAGEELLPPLPAAAARDRVYFYDALHERDVAYLADARPWSECRLARRLERYLAEAAEEAGAGDPEVALRARRLARGLWPLTSLGDPEGPGPLEPAGGGADLEPLAAALERYRKRCEGAAAPRRPFEIRRLDGGESLYELFYQRKLWLEELGEETPEEKLARRLLGEAALFGFDPGGWEGVLHQGHFTESRRATGPGEPRRLGVITVIRLLRESAR